ncbi:hypothetical protein BHU72_11150 [Desulfuribacillus stibiiarsenatis]|uniref:VWFA domain-containing protein n=1 Tax=Desulfuribacillus stibiiarsenatis TaxID=1390249 RepID=A0A1E5L2S0_9FIRM|nr:VWA domain-containing protein [Desulfuribacillus stibiiarsenatis]OEH84353.1 hypothetical protein BHU72_11150 [Desulfuribacillus stibiiarsenatis]
MAELKQVLLITDGCSNVGADPVEVARDLARQGITVNVIGIIDYGMIGEKGIAEVQSIAQAGGGICEVVKSQDLSYTVQAVTQQAMTMTIEHVVNRQLNQMLGSNRGLQALSPEGRGEVVEWMEDLSEQTPLKIILLIDVSASMKQKMKNVEEAIYNLSLSLQARSGPSEIAVLAFPGNVQDPTRTISTFTREPGLVVELCSTLQAQGATPTGPALMEVQEIFGTSHRGELADYVM